MGYWCNPKNIIKKDTYTAKAFKQTLLPAEIVCKVNMYVRDKKVKIEINEKRRGRRKKERK